MKNIIYVSSILFVLFPFDGNTQDIHFAQFDKSPLVLNPGLTGAIYKTQANLNYRNQWTSVDSPFQTYAVSVDQRIRTKNKSGFLALGVYALSDNAASTIKTVDLKVNIAGHVKINRNSTIGLGIQGGLLQRTIDPSRFQWGSQYDGNNYNSAISNAEGSTYNSVKAVDISTGLVYSYSANEYHKVTGNNDKILNFGVSVSHINRPSISFVGSEEVLPIKVTVFANSLYSLPNSILAIGPSLMYSRQLAAREVLIGTRFRYLLQEASKVTGFHGESAASIGFYYRHKDAIIALLQYEMLNYTIGFSYDLNVSKLSAMSNLRGGFELSLRYAAPAPFGKNSVRFR